jgi:hypothetical protein
MTSREDPELRAMRLMTEAFDGLEADAVGRVLRWAQARFAPTGDQGHDEGSAQDSSGEATDTQMFEEIADIMDAASATTGAERVLVTAYWFQVGQGAPNITGQQVNDELKNLGIGVSNVTMAFDDLMKRKPALAMQVQKSGKSKQARKKYKLTSAGIRHVERMFRGEDEEE